MKPERSKPAPPGEIPTVVFDGELRIPGLVEHMERLRRQFPELTNASLARIFRLPTRSEEKER
jgi:hypothetical protein